METPWGESDSEEVLADGITLVLTPSHGGIRLSDERQKQLPEGIENFLHDAEWWEEDLDWAIPYIAFQDAIGESTKNAWLFSKMMEGAYVTFEFYHLK